MSLEPILESTESWCRSNIGGQAVPRRRTSDGECPVAKLHFMTTSPLFL